ncbi:MAG: SusC/RagA family TonB-linked outer membrane protein, partial [Bacteroidetes bacterium]|nr:SusC/RagA family TonB-linked outer membrane protein [Bacteroidota bacterium]
LYNRGLGAQFLNYEGTYIPPHTLGWMNDFKAGNFDLMVLLTGTFGNVYRDPAYNYATATLGSNKTFVNKFISDVYAGNPNVPNFPNPKETQMYLWDRYVPYLSGLVESASYIQCKEIDLGYELPSKIAHTLQMNSLRVYAQARDLGMIWHANKKGYNPDWLPGSNRPVTTWLLGINFQF